MLTDRYGLLLSTTSSAARDAYLDGCEAKLTMYPGRSRLSIAPSPPTLALPLPIPPSHTRCWSAATRRWHACQWRWPIPSPAACPPGKRSHVAFFDLLVAGETEAALSALSAHLYEWPRDVLVLATTAFTNGLIGSSGRAGQKRAVLDLLERLAPSWG
jgi:hypothetical protein